MSHVDTQVGALHYDIWHIVFCELARQDAKMYHLPLDQEDINPGHRPDIQRDRHLLSPEFRTWAREIRYVCRDFDDIMKLYVYQDIDISQGRSMMDI
ncbi:hypothetical protein IFR05_008292 [Cadophora sp. M221]|nr:hypothetical protein IFR05_008292 [Cadophora sp. M221]